ncbi:MAG: hypothetical protein VXY61_03430 [Bacteroidota bacterium]|nr:hypothetical protein [Bacteroidota bacterium]
MTLRHAFLVLCPALWLAIGSTVSWGQTTHSPYSRFAFGDLQSGASAPQMGMGQLGAAWMDRHHLNTRNPAAAAFLTRTTFAGGFGLRAEKIMEGDSTTRGEVGGLTQVAFALKRAGGKGAITFGLQPWSNAGYDVSQIRTDDTADEYRISYAGEGGLAQSHIGYARRWEGTRWKRFEGTETAKADSSRIISHVTALGARYEQRFGSLLRSRTIDVANPIYLDTRVETEEAHRSSGFTVGFGHERLLGSRFDRDHKLVASTLLRLGGFAQLGRGHRIDRVTRWASWQTLSTGPLEVDSVYQEEAVHDIDLPLSWSIGAELERNTESGMRIRAGAEWEQAPWSSIPGDWLDPGVAFTDSRTAAMGVSLTPRGLDDAKGMWQRATYSLGWRTTSGTITLSEGDLASSTMSFGWSLPMLGSRSGSSLDLAFQWRTLQAGDNPLGLRERSFGATVGFTLHPFFKNQWLVPRKYD